MTDVGVGPNELCSVIAPPGFKEKNYQKKALLKYHGVRLQRHATNIIIFINALKLKFYTAFFISNAKEGHALELLYEDDMQ